MMKALHCDEMQDGNGVGEIMNAQCDAMIAPHFGTIYYLRTSVKKSKGRRRLKKPPALKEMEAKRLPTSRRSCIF